MLVAQTGQIVEATVTVTHVEVSLLFPCYADDTSCVKNEYGRDSFNKSNTVSYVFRMGPSLRESNSKRNLNP